MALNPALCPHQQPLGYCNSCSPKNFLPMLPMSDLGYANGWSETPAVVEKCNHAPERKKIGNCLHEVKCDICNYKYKVDSGG